MVHVTVKSVPLSFILCNYLTVTGIQIFILELHSNVCDYTLLCPNLKNYSVTHEKIIVTGFWKTDHIVMHEINKISMFMHL